MGVTLTVGEIIAVIGGLMLPGLSALLGVLRFIQSRHEKAMAAAAEARSVADAKVEAMRIEFNATMERRNGERRKEVDDIYSRVNKIADEMIRRRDFEALVDRIDKAIGEVRDDMKEIRHALTSPRVPAGAD